MSPGLPIPKYHQIYLVLREQLEEGRYADGVPGELQLTRSFGVARVTVRRALERLVADGLIARVPGRGTVALRPAPPQDAGEAAPARMPELLQNIVDLGLATSVHVHECGQLPAPASVAGPLDLAPGAPVQKAVRVRSTPAGPVSHITTWVPAALAQAFGRRELALKPLLILLEESGVRIGSATQSISARLADAEVARRLQVDVGAALLAVSRLVRDEHERPVQWLQGLYRPDRYQYRMQLSRVGEVDAKVWVSQELTAQFH